MNKLVRLSESELQGRLSEMPAWHLRADQLSRSFEFSDFVEAFGFMTSVALVSERLGHHPNWSNVYNRVEIALSTHEVDGISDNDLLLAAMIDQIFLKARPDL